MTSVAALRDCFSQNSWVSPESQTVGQPVQRLLSIGWEMGLSTSCTEAEASGWSDPMEQRFQHLAKIWRDECVHLSSIREMVLHPAYQQIIGMGEKALPLIFARLECESEHWFWALRAITQEDPVPPERRGNVPEMARYWLRWAEKKGIR